LLIDFYYLFDVEIPPVFQKELIEKSEQSLVYLNVAMSNSCSICQTPFHESSRLCPGCNSDLGFPNVRAAQKPAEVEALQQRVMDAQVSARARNCEQVVLQFRESVKSSRAVINRHIGVVLALVSNDNALYNTFYQSVEAEARLPEDNPFDRSRSSIDSTLFPHYHKEMRFAALSLDGHGIRKYGDLTIVLKEDIIKNRASVFEENSMDFCRRQRIVVGSPIPLGYRANLESETRPRRCKTSLSNHF
jgi:hypothetical protein